jgi:hypothetical protein
MATKQLRKKQGSAPLAPTHSSRYIREGDGTIG